jgi:dihydroflavonol-4-reductase
MAGRRVLITGGCGFVGRHVVDLLVQQGDVVRVLDTDTRHPLGPEVELRPGSICDEEAVRQAMRGVEHVYHLAANPHLWAADKGDFARVNHEGTRSVLAAAAREGVARVVHTSTISLWSRRAAAPEAAAPGAAAQDTAAVPGTAAGGLRRLDVAEAPGHYCRSKLLAEQEADRAAAAGLPVVIVIPTLPIGPGDHHLTPPSQMILNFIRGRVPAYLDCQLNFVDVRDLARGHLLAAERGTVGEHYILGGENLSLADLLHRLERLTGRPMPRLAVPYWLALVASLVCEFLADHVTHRPPIAPIAGVRLACGSMWCESEQAARDLGYQARPVDQALLDFIEWLAAEGQIAPLHPPASGLPVGRGR